MSTDIEPLQGRHRATTRTSPGGVLAAAGGVTLLVMALLLLLQLRQGIS